MPAQALTRPSSDAARIRFAALLHLAPESRHTPIGRYTPPPRYANPAPLYCHWDRGKLALNGRPVLGAAGVSLAMAGGANAPAAYAPSQDPGPRILLAEEEIFDVSLATFHVFDKERDSRSANGLRLAAGCRGGGCGCGGGMAAAAAEAIMVAEVAAAAVAAWVLGCCSGCGGGCRPCWEWDPARGIWPNC